MIDKPMDVLRQYPVRKGKRRKQAFRDDVQAYLKTLGYESTVEKGSLGSRNLVIGNPDEAEWLVTAHYDTCARLPFPNLITPCNPVTFILYQLFAVLIMFAFMGAGGALVYLLTRDGFWAFWTGYLLLWVFLVLMMVGPANRTNANDNTSGVVTVLEITRNLPESQRSRVCFVLFDLEEAGLIGSSSYQNRHKKTTPNQVVLNLDCVGDGDEIMLFPTKKLKKDADKMDTLRPGCGSFGAKSMSLRQSGFSVYPSDQANFPYGVGIAAFRRCKWVGLYCGRIHTHRDTILEEENVNLLRGQILKIVCGAAKSERKMENESL